MSKLKRDNIKSVNINILQAQASQIVKDVEKGKTYKIMRYSQPVAVLMSQEQYECLTGECRGCVQQLVDKLQAANSKLQISNNK